MPSQAATTHETYRPDLDGLRGIAVAAVVAYHLHLPFASGGFVGVDIFFVLSGFLITRIIAGELERGTFGLGPFYERRIRRIVPALVVVCAVTTVFAIAILLPGELRRYADSLMATAFSISNFWCNSLSGYFGPAAEVQPLFHTWSLGVEEQFYLLFPLFLWAIAKWPKKYRGGIVWAMFFMSLALSILMLKNDPESTFFLLHTRAWELLTGSVIALRIIPGTTSPVVRESAGFVGLVAILTTIMVYDSKTPFPGAAALLPCVGAGLIVWSGEARSVVARLLSFRPLIGLGLISYSLYLWHWPLIVYARLLGYPIHDIPVQLTLLALSVVLAALTWQFVEQPFRRRGAARVGPRSIYVAGGSSLAALAAVGAGLLALNGLPQRFSPEVVALEAGSYDASPLRQKCHVPAFEMTFDKTCILGADVLPQIIVLGDSHGAELSVVLGKLAEVRGGSIRQVTASGCAPALDFKSFIDARCAQHNEAVLSVLKALPPTTIVMAAHSIMWSRHYPNYWDGYRKTVTALRGAGHRVILIGPVPSLPDKQPMPVSLARWVSQGNAPADFVFKTDADELRTIDATINQIASDTGATYVPYASTFCSDEGCRPYLDGVALYFDDNHLSMSGAKLMAERHLVPLLWPDVTSKVIGETHTQ